MSLYDYGEYNISDMQMAGYLNELLRRGYENYEDVPQRLREILDAEFTEQSIDDESQLLTTAEINMKGWYK